MGKGRAKTIVTKNTQIAMPLVLIQEIDNWRRLQPELPTRNESIRKLLWQALGLSIHNV